MAKDTRPDAVKTEEQKLKERQALATRRFYFLIAMLVLIVLFAFGSLYIWITMPRVGDDGRPLATDGPFAVEKIVLSGNTQYDQETVLYESNVVIGQSIFTVKTEEVEKALLETFPYYTSVEVQTVGMSEVHIDVSETTAIGVVASNGSWVTVGKNGKALDRKPMTSNTPKGQLYLKGTFPPENGVAVGGDAMDELSMDTVITLINAIERVGLTDIIEIDMSNPSNIRMNWRGQIEIHLGNNSNLEHEINVAAECIPNLITLRGKKVSGILDLTSYSNKDLDDQAVFTPSSLISGPTVSSADTQDEP